uniref:Poly(ADP-ribose) glycohydrolase n=1 Tax=Macrostomum lignano TaxID=282301 RepID=A0A1I8FIE2_9PLAT
CPELAASAPRGVVTGNWGCGAFGGDPQLKSLLQWLVASQLELPVLQYHKFSDSRVDRHRISIPVQPRQLEEVSEKLQSAKCTVGQLWKRILDYCKIASKEFEKTDSLQTELRTAAVSAAASTDLVSTAEQPTGTSVEAAFQQQPKSASAAPQQPAAVGVECLVFIGVPSGQLASGLEPQDIRFPVNIAQVAFTATYFAALTSDRRQSLRQPPAAWRRRPTASDAPSTSRRPIGGQSAWFPSTTRDVLCVVLRSRVEFHCLASGTRVGAYETRQPRSSPPRPGTAGRRSVLSGAPSGAAAAPRASQPPPRPPSPCGRTATDAPKRALLLGQSVAGRAERFLRFHWTSEDAVLLVSRLAG